jgi:imidazolonepropionase-like amidohydrolase
MMKKILVGLTATGVLGSALMFPASVDAAISALIGDRVIDGRSAKALTDVAVLVEDDRITGVVKMDQIPEGAQRVQLDGYTLMPGMVELHTHPTIAGDDYQFEHLRKSSAQKGLEALKSVQDMLNAGWTSIRTAGAADVNYAIVDVKRAIDSGLFAGPRMQVAGHYITITGGGGDINFIAPEHHVIPDGLRADGVEEMRKAVRREVKYGSDWIKILATGAFMSAADDPKDVHFSPEEMQVVMDEANRLRKPVMAHAHSAEGIKLAVRAGVRSIEHGTFLDAEGVKLMAERGTYLVPTLYIGDYYIEEMADSQAQAKMVALSKKYRAEALANVGAAIKGGVKVAVGVDFGHYEVPASLYAREFALLIEAGMTPMEAIKAGTSLGAEVMGWDDRLGTLEQGKLADIIAVPGNPLEDISALERVGFVMLGGKVVRQP